MPVFWTGIVIGIITFHEAQGINSPKCCGFTADCTLFYCSYLTDFLLKPRMACDKQGVTLATIKLNLLT